MDIHRGYRSAGDALRGAAVAIGNFDGLHRGHQALFEEAGRNADRVTALTFEPHPVKVLAPHLAPPLLMTQDEKLQGLDALGLHAVVVQPFDLKFAQTAPSAFVQDLLLDALQVGHVVVGPDFNFGKGGAGDTDLLRALLAEGGAGLSVVPPVKEGGMVCSSSQIRQFVLEGRVDAAELLLGHELWLEGLVNRGDGRGRQLGIPTANLDSEREAVPKVGVYATRLVVGDQTLDSVTNIGLRPTFEKEESGASRPGPSVRIEAHALDLPPETDLYGQRLRLIFVKRLRDEKRFSGPDALIAQIHADIAAARKALASPG